MTDKEVAQLVEKEFTEKTLGVTEQYLDIHQPIYKNGQLVIDRIDRESADKIIAYLPVDGEYFFFAVYIDIASKEIFSIGTESGNIVSLIATSETLSSNDLQSFIKIKASERWDKGDLRPNKKLKYNFSGIGFNPNPEPDEFEDKLKKLLIFLQQDKAGVRDLVANSNTFIRVIMDFHRGNQLLGGAVLNSENIKHIADLNLEVSFEITAWGEPFR